MKIEIFTKADNVQVYENRFVIIGTFDSITSSEVPFVFRPFNIALKAIAEKKDIEKNYACHICIRKKRNRKRIVEVPFELKFQKPSEKESNSIIQINTIINNIRIDSWGLYVIEFLVNNRVLASSEFAVKEGKADPTIVSVNQKKDDAGCKSV